MGMKSVACQHCGRVHPGLLTSYGFRQPDEVYALSSVGRYLRVRGNADICTLDESRYFLRGYLLLPFADRKGEFSWGVWVEVSKHDHDAYLAQIESGSDGSSSPCFVGRLANAVPGYRSTLGIAVEVQLGEPTARPCGYRGGLGTPSPGSNRRVSPPSATTSCWRRAGASRDRALQRPNKTQQTAAHDPGFTVTLSKGRRCYRRATRFGSGCDAGPGRGSQGGLCNLSRVR